MVNMTPSAFYEIAGAVRGGGFPSCVRIMMLAGEALDITQVRRWFADRDAEGVIGPRLNNMYGPTEATVYATRRELTREFVEETPAGDVGGALPETRLYVLDSRLAAVPDGVPGDVYLAGAQLADGYAHRPALTAARFVADPFGGAGDRMYLTGDVGLLRDGSLEFLGRSDDQVKLRGYRIELGEVESVMSAAPGVVAAAADVYGDERSTDRLVGYVTGAGATGESVREFVRTRLPDYMVPDVVMILARLPLTLNGKLDRRALPAPVFGAAAEYVAPQGSVEVTVEQICARVLGVERVSVVESVFDVGGNSMLAARIVARVCDEFGVDLNLRDLFDEPTVRGLAVRVARANAGLPAVTAVSPRPERIPLSFAQARMWFVNQLDTASSAYNIPLVLRITGTLDVEALRQAVVDVVIRHEVLRTVFAPTGSGAGDAPGDDQPCQLIADPESITGQLDWSVVEDRSGIDEAVGRGFDVSTNWPIRVRVCRTGVAEHLLAIVVHHIAADGESLAPLVSDLLTAYGARTRGAVPDIEPLAVQMAARGARHRRRRGFGHRSPVRVLARAAGGGTRCSRTPHGPAAPDGRVRAGRPRRIRDTRSCRPPDRCAGTRAGGHTVHGGACRSGRVARQAQRIRGYRHRHTHRRPRPGGARSGRGYVREHTRTAYGGVRGTDDGRAAGLCQSHRPRRLRACGRAVREHRRAVGAACRTGVRTARPGDAVVQSDR